MIDHADSHTGALMSDKVHPQFYNALKYFGMQTQGSCPFTVSTAVTLSSSAVTWPFNLTTQDGCLWSAVSQNSWITVNTPNGTSTGTVSTLRLPKTLPTSQDQAPSLWAMGVQLYRSLSLRAAHAPIRFLKGRMWLFNQLEATIPSM